MRNAIGAGLRSCEASRPLVAERDAIGGAVDMEDADALCGLSAQMDLERFARDPRTVKKVPSMMERSNVAVCEIHPESAYEVTSVGVVVRALMLSAQLFGKRKRRVKPAIIVSIHSLDIPNEPKLRKA